ncbi:MAG TPA: DUF3243 domain-containing protein [Bacillales bacterium]|nr:DUF3243 domain-containing protein [Bacillales bacterium]
MSVLENFNEWKEFLGHRLQHAENKGVDQSTITNLATEIGGYLASQVDPKNNEERLLADLWNSASEDERHALASVMVKYVQNEGRQTKH